MWFLLEGGYANTQKSNKKNYPKETDMEKKKKRRLHDNINKK